MDKLAATVAAGEAVEGDQLLTLARHVGVDVNPRTAGLLRRRVAWIKAGTAGVTGKGGAGQAHAVYDAVRAKVATAPAV